MQVFMQINTLESALFQPVLNPFLVLPALKHGHDEEKSAVCPELKPSKSGKFHI